uniref:Uncharacterized protein n=1 Tax=Salix viminalis TaxID=40686 RepID=A0A6N2MJJ6_SALVM
MAQYKKHRLTIEGNLEPSTSSPIHLCSSRSLLETWHNTRNIVLPQKENSKGIFKCESITK